MSVLVPFIVSDVTTRTDVNGVKTELEKSVTLLMNEQAATGVAATPDWATLTLATPHEMKYDSTNANLSMLFKLRNWDRDMWLSSGFAVTLSSALWQCVQQSDVWANLRMIVNTGASATGIGLATTYKVAKVIGANSPISPHLDGAGERSCTLLFEPVSIPAINFPVGDRAAVDLPIVAQRVLWPTTRADDTATRLAISYDFELVLKLKPVDLAQATVSMLSARRSIDTMWHVSFEYTVYHCKIPREVDRIVVCVGEHLQLRIEKGTLTIDAKKPQAATFVRMAKFPAPSVITHSVNEVSL